MEQDKRTRDREQYFANIDRSKRYHRQTLADIKLLEIGLGIYVDIRDSKHEEQFELPNWMKKIKERDKKNAKK